MDDEDTLSQSSTPVMPDPEEEKRYEQYPPMFPMEFNGEIFGGPEWSDDTKQ